MTIASAPPVAANALIWQRLIWPQPFPEGDALALLRHLAAQTPAPQLILEARADVTGVKYLIGSQVRYASAVRRVVEQLVDGAFVSSFDQEDRGQIVTARRLQLNTTARPLEPVDPVASSRSILHALTSVGRGERLIIQVVLGPRLSPKLIPSDLHQEGQTMLSKVLHGVLPEKRADARKRSLTSSASTPSPRPSGSASRPRPPSDDACCFWDLPPRLAPPNRPVCV